MYIWQRPLAHCDLERCTTGPTMPDHKAEACSTRCTARRGSSGTPRCSKSDAAIVGARTNRLRGALARQSGQEGTMEHARTRMTNKSYDSRHSCKLRPRGHASKRRKCSGAQPMACGKEPMSPASARAVYPSLRDSLFRPRPAPWHIPIRSVIASLKQDMEPEVLGTAYY